MDDPYLTAYNAFVPEHDDNPACIPYYRAAVGLRAVWGRDFCDRYHSVFHRAFCAAGAVPPEKGLAVAKDTLREMAQTMTPPRPPITPMFYAAEPRHQDARAYFNEEFKRAHPGERANSKKANSLWADKKEMVELLVQTLYEREMAWFEKQRRDHEALRERNLASYNEALREHEEFVKLALARC